MSYRDAPQIMRVALTAVRAALQAIRVAPKILSFFVGRWSCSTCCETCSLVMWSCSSCYEELLPRFATTWCI